MRYVKALGLFDKRKLAGYFDFEKNVIVVDFSLGLFRAVLTSYHEFLHKILDFFPAEDWLDLLSPLLNLNILIRTPKEWIRLFQVIFLTEHQTYYPLEDEQRGEVKK